jgi:hypothetical protein
MISLLFVTLMAIGIMTYGVCYALGGPRLVKAYSRWLNRSFQGLMRWLGRKSGRTAVRYPRIAGVAILIVALMIVSRC